MNVGGKHKQSDENAKKESKVNVEIKNKISETKNIFNGSSIDNGHF